MMKKFVALMLVFSLVCTCCALGEGVRVAALKGPTAMGMVAMMNESDNYDFEICAAADEITPKLAKGEIDIAALPANLAAVLYQRMEGEIEVLAVNTLGVLYIVTTDDSVNGIADLKGRTIYSAGKGATPEYALNYILRANGLEPGADVTVEYKAEHSECLSALLSDEGSLALLPQPFITTALSKAPGMRVAIDLNAEWDALQNGSALITGVVVARRVFVRDNSEIVSAFMDDYAASVEWVNANTADAAALIEKFDIVPAAVAEQALPACNICFIRGEEMKTKLSGYLGVLCEADSASVGGALPDDDFYYAG